MFTNIVDEYFNFPIYYENYKNHSLWYKNFKKISNNHLSLCDEETPKKHSNKCYRFINKFKKIKN